MDLLRKKLENRFLDLLYIANHRMMSYTSFIEGKENGGDEECIHQKLY